MNCPRFLALALATLAAPLVIVAAPLDDAPFRIVLPDSGWKISDASSKPMAQGVELVATVSNPRERLKTFVIRQTLSATNENALIELAGGIHDSFLKSKVNLLAQTDTPFLGFKARNFACEMAHGAQTNYNAITVFVAKDVGWTITCAGRPAQSNDVQRMFGFFRLK